MSEVEDPGTEITGDELTLYVDGQAFKGSDDNHTSSYGMSFWSSSGLTWTAGQTVALELVEETISNDATLTGLVLNDGNSDLTPTPAFASGTTSYTAEVTNDIDQVTVTPTTSDPDATVEYLDGSDNTIADADTETSGHQINLAVGANTIRVEITAEDGVTTDIYAVSVTRLPAHCDGTELWCVTMTVGGFEINSNPIYGWIEAERRDGGAISPNDRDFEYNNQTYTIKSVTLDYTQRLTVTFNTSEVEDPGPGAIGDQLVLYVDGQAFYRSADNHSSSLGMISWSSSGLTWTAGQTVALEFVKIEAIVSRVETVEPVPPVTPNIKDLATLTGLVLNDGTRDLTLAPAFGTGTTSYRAAVPNDIDQVTVTPTTSDPDATVEYLDGSDNTIADANGIAAGHQVDLAEGDNSIKVKVSAEDSETTETYTVVVARRQPALVQTGDVKVMGTPQVSEYLYAVLPEGSTDHSYQWYRYRGAGRNASERAGCGRCDEIRWRPRTADPGYGTRDYYFSRHHEKQLKLGATYTLDGTEHTKFSDTVRIISSVYGNNVAWAGLMTVDSSGNRLGFSHDDFGTLLPRLFVYPRSDVSNIIDYEVTDLYYDTSDGKLHVEFETSGAGGQMHNHDFDIWFGDPNSDDPYTYVDVPPVTAGGNSTTTLGSRDPEFELSISYPGWAAEDKIHVILVGPDRNGGM